MTKSRILDNTNRAFDELEAATRLLVKKNDEAHEKNRLLVDQAFQTSEDLESCKAEKVKLEARILELEKDEPVYDDVVALRKALTLMGVSVQGSDEEMGCRWLSHVRSLCRAINNRDWSASATQSNEYRAILQAIANEQSSDPVALCKGVLRGYDGDPV